nr:asparagine--tRNA ligase, cytoplasmic 1-like [Ipomoea batatas]
MSRADPLFLKSPDPNICLCKNPIPSAFRKKPSTALSVSNEKMSVDSTPPVEKLSLSDSVAKAEFSQRVLIKSILGRPDGGAGLAGQVVKIGGWVKTGREQGKGAFAFLEVNDGSCPANLQVIVDAAVHKLGDLVATGTSVHVEGALKLPPEGTKQKVELRVQKVIAVGTVDAAKYPLPKTKLTLEFLRDVVHLRSRTNTISSLARIRNALAYATHTFFQKHGFLYVHTPIVTTSDCEGAGEMFQVTTLISEAEKLEKDMKENPAPSESDIKAAEQLVKEKGEAVAKLKSEKASIGKDDPGVAEINKKISAAVGELTRAKENLVKLEERFKLGERCKHSAGMPMKDGKIDYSQDFFARQAFLTVSGQLQVETYACALSSVYTFGPTFRAENSHTSRHLAEFWMVEPEIAFADIEDDMNCAEAYVRFLCQWLLDNCLDDMEFIAKFIDKGAINRLRLVASSDFHRITYTEAITILEEAAKVKKFENKVEWGIDLASEHERYLTEEHFKAPTIVYNYPKGIKAFYMKVNEDKKTVAAMDVLVPKVGELIGGSQREENYEVLRDRILEMGLPLEPYEWYLDLRRYGTVKHSGFGLGFERMILFATGVENIRDVIPFPRYPGRADL